MNLRERETAKPRPADGRGNTSTTVAAGPRRLRCRKHFGWRTLRPQNGGVMAHRRRQRVRYPGVQGRKGSAKRTILGPVRGEKWKFQRCFLGHFEHWKRRRKPQASGGWMLKCGQRPQARNARGANFFWDPPPLFPTFFSMNNGKGKGKCETDVAAKAFAGIADIWQRRPGFEAPQRGASAHSVRAGSFRTCPGRGLFFCTDLPRSTIYYSCLLFLSCMLDPPAKEKRKSRGVGNCFCLA